MAEEVGVRARRHPMQNLKKLHKKFFWLGTYIFGVGGILCRERPQEAEDFGWERLIRGY
jgi:hypothetical protein